MVHWKMQNEKEYYRNNPEDKKTNPPNAQKHINNNNNSNSNSNSNSINNNTKYKDCINPTNSYNSQKKKGD